MKKLLFVVMAIAIVAVAVLSYLGYYFYTKSVDESNRKKTEPAREARHKKNVEHELNLSHENETSASTV
jgi:Tfp pilus assembly protein PilE